MSKRSKWNRAPPKRHEHLQLKMCYSRSGNARRKKNTHRRTIASGGKSSIGFVSFRFVLFHFTIASLCTHRVYLRDSEANEQKHGKFAWKHCKFHLHRAWSRAYAWSKYPYAEKKPLQLTFFFSFIKKKCFFRSILHTDKNRNDSTAQYVLVNGTSLILWCIWVKSILRIFFCTISLPRFSSFAAIYFQWLLVSLSYAECGAMLWTNWTNRTRTSQ